MFGQGKLQLCDGTRVVVQFRCQYFSFKHCFFHFKKCYIVFSLEPLPLLPRHWRPLHAAAFPVSPQVLEVVKIGNGSVFNGTKAFMGVSQVVKFKAIHPETEWHQICVPFFNNDCTWLFYCGWRVCSCFELCCCGICLVHGLVELWVESKG